MKYILKKNKIIIEGKEDFNTSHILECGQIFAYSGNLVYSSSEKAVINETENGFEIDCTDEKYFENFFDLKTDYSKIKKELSRSELLKKPIQFGYGIRILKNDIFETLISFIVSANNNIKRIQLILSRMREKLGENKGDYFAFPTYEKLLSVSEEFFKDIGCGYRAGYLYKVLRQIDIKEIYEWKNLPTDVLRNKLIALSGIGPKVADCILLFGYGKQDVFPVDTWINQMYNQYYHEESNRNVIRKELTEEFGNLSGYAQQYLFYWQRSAENKEWEITLFFDNKF